MEISLPNRQRAKHLARRPLLSIEDGVSFPIARQKIPQTVGGGVASGVPSLAGLARPVSLQARSESRH